MSIHWTFSHGGWVWPLALGSFVAIGVLRAWRPAPPEPQGPAKSRRRRLLERLSWTVGLGFATLWAVGAIAERMLPDIFDSDGIESAEHLHSLASLRVMAVTPFHRNDALDMLNRKLRSMPFSASRRAMQESVTRVHGDCEARLSNLLDYRDYEGVLDAGCSTEETRELEATAAFFTGDFERASDLMENAQDARYEEKIRIHLLAGKPERAVTAAIAARDRLRQRHQQDGDADLQRWSIAFDCLAAGMDRGGRAPSLEELYAKTEPVECRLLQAWRASGERRKAMLEGRGEDATPFSDTPFETTAHLLLLELAPSSDDSGAWRVDTKTHVLSASYGAPTDPLERAALSALERASALPPGPKALLRRLKIRAALDDAYLHRFDDARRRIDTIEVAANGWNVEHARALVDLWAGDTTAAALRNLPNEGSADYARDWLDAARGRPVERFSFGFELIAPALGPSQTFPPELYTRTWMIDDFLRTLAPLAPFLPREALAEYMHAAQLSRRYRFDPGDAITYLVDLAHIHDATGNHELAQRRLSVAKALREAWTTDNAVPLVVLDEFVWLSMNDASSVD